MSFSHLFIRFCAVGAMVSASFAQTTIPAEEVPALIRPRFQLGNTYRFVVTTAVKTHGGNGGIREAIIEQQARFDTAVRVDGEKGVVLKGRTERLDVQLQSGGRSLTFHSLEPEDRATPMGRHFQTSLNRSVTLTLNTEGRVVASEEGGRAESEVPLPGIPRFGPDELKQIITLITQGFSAKGVVVGDTWSLRGSRSVADMGLMNFDVNYRFTGPVNFEDNRCIAIDFGGQMQGDVSPPNEGGNPVITGEMSVQASSIRGRILFDPLDKMVRFSEQNIEMLIALPDGAGGPSQQVPVQETTTIRLLHVVPTQ